MGDVVKLPGVGAIDCGHIVPPQEVLEHALTLGLLSVVVVGRQRCGCLYIAGSEPDPDIAIAMLERAKHDLCDFEIMHVSEEEPPTNSPGAA